MDIKEYATVIAIGVLFSLFFGLLVDALYEAPVYDNYCVERGAYTKPIRDMASSSCTYDAAEQQRIDYCYNDKGQPIFVYNEQGCQVYSECDYCGVEYNAVNQRYNRNLFFILSPLAVIAIVIGLLWTLTIIGSGVMFGGILLLLYSTARYFSDMSKPLRVIIVFVELLLIGKENKTQEITVRAFYCLLVHLNFFSLSSLPLLNLYLSLLILSNAR